MKVIGIDPSLTATGIADADGATSVLNHWTGDQRLPAIFARVEAIAIDVDLAVIEDLPVHGMGAGKTGMAQGAVRLALISAGCPYVTVPPASLKKFATGKGSATKADLRVELVRRTGTDIRDDNEVDAYWLRQLGLAHYGEHDVQLPAANITALQKIDWSPAPDGVE